MPFTAQPGPETAGRFKGRGARTALSPSKVPGVSFSLNPYVGCMHACRYCYMRIIHRNRDKRRWGTFVDAKQGLPSMLVRELKRKRKRGPVMLSSATDPYQPIEKELGITRSCLGILSDARFPARVQTKSALVARDIDILREFKEARITITITTDSEEVRRKMEPGASPIAERLRALRALYEVGLSPRVFVGPALPMNPKALARAVKPFASSVLFDDLHYHSLCRHLLKARGWDQALDPGFFDRVLSEFSEELGEDLVEEVC